MKIAGFTVRYVSHVSFLITSPGGATVLTDPLFAEGFAWHGHFERYLSPPTIAPGDIVQCDAVFVSHIHGDHFDPGAIEIIMQQTGAKVWAPADVTEALGARGLDPECLVTLEEGASPRLAGVTATAFAGYDRSLDEQGRANKFSLLLEAGGRRIFYSGDCHEPPPAMAGHKVDLVIAWPHPDDQKLVALGRAITTDYHLLMHGDRFEPGDFFCNMDYKAEKRRMERLLPEVQVIIPERIEALGTSQ